MNVDQVINLLKEKKVVSQDLLSVEAMSGGVSCEVFLLTFSNEKRVLKMALEKLETKDEWFADVRRNKTEQNYIDLGSRLLPLNFPRIIYGSEENFFLMEYLGDDYKTLKSDFLAGIVDSVQAERAGKILGIIHSSTYKNMEVARKFHTKKDFYDLRVDSYILTTGKRNVVVEEFFDKMAKDLMDRNECLVHGDYSPKNILVNASNMVIIDCETACYGDPAFDLAFFMNHLFLKSLFVFDLRDKFMSLPGLFLDSYKNVWNSEVSLKIIKRSMKLLPMLMLARVDGKSPAEYITSNSHKKFIRSFSIQKIKKPIFTVEDFIEEWLIDLNNI